MTLPRDIFEAVAGHRTQKFVTCFFYRSSDRSNMRKSLKKSLISVVIQTRADPKLPAQLHTEVYHFFLIVKKASSQSF